MLGICRRRYLTDLLGRGVRADQIPRREPAVVATVGEAELGLVHQDVGAVRESDQIVRFGRVTREGHRHTGFEQIEAECESRVHVVVAHQGRRDAHVVVRHDREGVGAR